MSDGVFDGLLAVSDALEGTLDTVQTLLEDEHFRCRALGGLEALKLQGRPRGQVEVDVVLRGICRRRRRRARLGARRLSCGRSRCTNFLKEHVEKPDPRGHQEHAQQNDQAPSKSSRVGAGRVLPPREFLIG